MPLVDTLLYLLALVGHAALWLSFGNRMHATGLPRRVVKLFTGTAEMVNVAGCLTLAAGAVGYGPAIVGRGGYADLPWGPVFYVIFCWLIAAGPVAWWLVQRLTARTPAALRSTRATTHDLGRSLGDRLTLAGIARLGPLFPGNDFLRVEVSEKELSIPRWPSELDGLVIAHLSDLHFTGRIGAAFYEEVIRLAGEMHADLAALTGDLIEHPACLDWAPAILARLRTRWGSWFVLGNHDKRIDAQATRRHLVSQGLHDLGGRWQTIVCDGQPLLLAGNELPWFGPAANLAGAPVDGPDGQRLPRVLLSHSPDQLPWARQRDFDLVLAGHTHGGQIRLPLLGPIVSPSRFGVRYASGTFHEPPTVMHVSRGLSSETPLRWNCVPEISRLVLRAGTLPERERDDSDSHHQLSGGAV